MPAMLLTTPRVCLALGWGAWLAAVACGADDGLRTVEVLRYGVRTRVPQAWRLITWARDAKAFELRLPQDAGSQVGYVRCELGIAPASLAAHRDRLAEVPVAGPKDRTQRRLVSNRLAKIDPERFGAKLAEQVGEMLETVWEVESETGQRSFEMQTCLLSEGTLYTFSLTTDEAHYDAYRLDYLDMLAACVFSAPDTGVRRLPGGFWLQRDYRFAMRLPEGWQPAFGPSDQALFFATGAVHAGETGDLRVMASPHRVLNLEQLKLDLPGQITGQEPQARVACELVPQGRGTALETVIRTRRGDRETTALERRFSGARRNYELRFTLETSEFERHAAALRQALDTFVEVAEAPMPGDA